MPIVNPPITVWNPHTGTPVDTIWDHKSTPEKPIKRLLPPAEVIREVEAMEYTSAFTDDASRCEVPVTIPICVDGNAPEKKSSWNLFELFRWSRTAVQSAPQRVMATLSPTLSNIQYFLGPGKYAQVFNFENRPGFSKEMQFAPHPSEVNHVTLGDVLRVSGGGQIDVGPNFIVLAAGGLYLSDKSVVEKNGVKYLKVKHGATQYGIKMEVI